MTRQLLPEAPAAKTVPAERERSFLLRVLGMYVAGPAPPAPLSEDLPLASLDWNLLLEVARREGVLPFVASVLKSGGQSKKLAGEAQDRLSASLWQAEWEMRIKEMEFRKINLFFAREGIRVIPLKGFALAQQVYETPAHRTMADLDLLIQEKDHRRAVDLLRDWGFRPKRGTYRWHAEIRDRGFGRSNFRKGELNLDLQWAPRFCVGDRLVEWEQEGVWKRASPLPSLGENVWMLHPADLIRHLLFQMGHDREHQHLYLRQLVDLALALGKFRADPARLLEDIAVASDPVWKNRLAEILQAVEECFFKNTNYTELSPSARGMIDTSLENIWAAPHWYYGLALKGRLSVVDKLLFMAGYFFPRKEYLRETYGAGPFSGIGLGYLRHVGRLARKAVRYPFQRCGVPDP